MKNNRFHYSRPANPHPLWGIIVVVILGLNTSCGNIKQLTYLQGPIDTAALGKINFAEPAIQKGDLLGITVYSDNQLASAVFNQGGASSATPASGGAPSVAASGYLVSQDGNIQLYEIGFLKVEGLTRRQLGDLLAKQYLERNLLNNPFVQVQFLNFKVTIVGDVNSPGVYTFQSDKITIFDALGTAGDLSIYARRDNILIVREVKDERRFARLDLTNPNIFNSPYFYLQQNDMIVVDPTRVKASVNDQTLRYIGIVTSVVSLVAILYSIFQ